MSGTNQKKSGGKKRAKRSRKPEQLNHEPDRLASPEPEQLHSQPPEPLHRPEPQPLQSQAPQSQTSQNHASQSQAPDQMHSETPAQHCDKEQLDAAIAPADIPAIDFHTLATAYGNYTKKSFAETKAYVEKLSGVRSIDKIVEIQTEFAKQAYETFVTESKKIRELYSGLAKQNLTPFESFVARKNRAAR
jgi:hypothetical protein